MSNIITAKEFIRKDFDEQRLDIKHVEWLLIEFAKLHCGEQQKEILNQVELITDIDVKHDGPVAKISINNDSILNAYPLENIK